MPAIWGIWNHNEAPDTSPALARMCGVLGIFGRVDCRHMAHIGMGRAISDTLAEDLDDQQPLLLENGDLLVASVRLDARPALAATLQCPAQAPDSQLLAAAWLRWGEQTPLHLTGEFAFAVWQPRRQQFFCCTDPMGMRSLFYAATPKQFAFATLPRAIHAAGVLPRQLKADALAAMLASFPETAHGTVFQGVHRLAGGNSLTATPQGLRTTQYWNPADAATVRLPSDEAYADAFRDVLDTAVRDRLRANGPVGTMLSGGFDSGSVTASAATILAAQGHSLPAFTAVPEPGFAGAIPADRFADESQHAAAVAALYPNIRHTLVTPLQQFPLDLATAQFARTDAPGGSLSLAGGGAAMVAAHRSAGMRVILNGVGGNLTISYNGLPLIPQLASRGRWRQWFRESRGLIQRAHFRWPGIFALSFGPKAPPFLWKYVQRRRSGAGSGLHRYAILHPSVMGRLHQLAEERGFDPLFRPYADGRRLRAQFLTQRNNAIHNPAVELRDPTTDRRVIEFCMGVPEEQFLRNGTTKYLLRRAMQGRLPAVVLNEWRKGLCGADWYLRVAPYRQRFAETLDDLAQSAFVANCLDLPRLRAMLDSWPSKWDSPHVATEYGMGFCQALQTGAFIRWVERDKL